MPDVVLRHPKLKGQPIVIHVALGGFVPASYADAGWEIDSNTSAADAVVEATDTANAAQDKAAKAEEKFVPKFESAEADPSSTGGSASTTTTKEI